MDKVEFIKQQGDALFNNRSQLMSLWQEIAENFYPERADFTGEREPGNDFVSYLDTSYPILARRDLGNTIGGMLRPTNKEWFSIVKQYDEDKIDTDAKQWLEWATKIQKRAMYDPIAMFTRATKEADNDWSAFGQAAMSIRVNLKENALLYRSWHLRDVAWREDYKGQVQTVFRKWKPDALTLNMFFEDVHPKIKECMKSNKPFTEFEVYHCEVPSEIYGNGEFEEFPLVSVYYDITNNHIMEEIGVWEGEYVIPRWQTVSGSQYAFSPATIVALPDARLIQSIARVLLDASDKQITPPMVAVQEAIRGDISVYAGGITWVDSEYDERLGEVLRELKSQGNIPIGFEMNDQIQAIIREAFYLNKLALPPAEPGMTAYEASERVAEYIRQALPLFEPMEDEYNAKVCEKSFNNLMRAGAFGPPQSIPRSLHGGDIKFKFESPMREATERIKGQRFAETKEVLASAMELDQTVGLIVDPMKTVRDVLDSMGSPAKWRRSEQEVDTLVRQITEKQQAEQAMSEIQQGAEIAKTASDAGVV